VVVRGLRIPYGLALGPTVKVRPLSQALKHYILERSPQQTQNAHHTSQNLLTNDSFHSYTSSHALVTNLTNSIGVSLT